MLPNPLRGEAALGEHKLVVDFNRFCALEAAMKPLKVPDLIARFKVGVDFGFSELRTYVRVFLDKPMTDEEVGDLISAIGQEEIEIPKELRRKGEPSTQLVWVASLRLNDAMDAFLAPRKEVRENPPLAA